MNFLDKDLAIHERALRLRGQRLEVLSANIANADTPNYKARDLDFRAAMAQAQGASTDPFAGTPTGEAAAPLKYRVPFN
ncbi:MAG: flagellar basal body rod protein FlgB, partial [Mycobacterium sp.]|nr:flagellar basal body rod protein FlgB [Mycobacterium sp.]